jgi:galactose oxidase
MRLSTVTHTHNTGQRRVPLGFTRAAGGLDVTAPSDRNVLLAGHHMLFVLKAGVPSVASIIHVG